MKLILMVLVAGLFIISHCSCVTPMSVKQSVPMSIQAIDTGLANLPAGTGEEIYVPFNDAKKLLAPVISYLGDPEMTKAYDHSKVDMHVIRAEIDVKLQKMVKETINQGLNNVLPSYLKPFADKMGMISDNQEKNKPDPMSTVIQTAIAVLIALLTAKGGGKVADVVVKKIKKGNSEKSN